MIDKERRRMYLLSLKKKKKANSMFKNMNVCKYLS